MEARIKHKEETKQDSFTSLHFFSFIIFYYKWMKNRKRIWWKTRKKWINVRNGSFHFSFSSFHFSHYTTLLYLFRSISLLFLHFSLIELKWSKRRTKEKKNRKNKWNENKRNACFFLWILLCSFPFFKELSSKLIQSLMVVSLCSFKWKVKLNEEVLLSPFKRQSVTFIWRTCCVILLLFFLSFRL